MACKRSAVRSRLPPPKFSRADQSKVLTPSSRGLGHHPFTVSTGVRIPVGSPRFIARWSKRKLVTLGPQGRTFPLPGVVVQLVRIPACHAGGRGFESRPLRQNWKAISRKIDGFFIYALAPPIQASRWICVAARLHSPIQTSPAKCLFLQHRPISLWPSACVPAHWAMWSGNSMS